jgi:hypothetical protein
MEISSYQFATIGHPWAGLTTCFAELEKSTEKSSSRFLVLKKNRLKSAQGSVVSKNGRKKGCKNSGALFRFGLSMKFTMDLEADQK